MAKYDNLPTKEKDLVDWIVIIANMDRKKIENWPMLQHCKTHRILELHDKVKTDLCKILLSV